MLGSSILAFAIAWIGEATGHLLACSIQCAKCECVCSHKVKVHKSIMHDQEFEACLYETRLPQVMELGTLV